MQPQVITVHDIHQSVEDVGVRPYANTLVQDMGGEYWFVDADRDDKLKPVSDGYTLIESSEMRPSGGVFPDGTNRYRTVTVYWTYRIYPVPLRLAHFIIETLRLKAQFGRLGVGDIDEPAKQSVYLTPGTKIFGHEITELTEVPAELRPVVVERL